jgi:hypothetical protein
MEKKKL